MLDFIFVNDGFIEQILNYIHKLRMENANHITTSIMDFDSFSILLIYLLVINYNFDYKV